jgi:hypothetical protein
MANALATSAGSKRFLIDMTTPREIKAGKEKIYYFYGEYQLTP